MIHSNNKDSPFHGFESDEVQKPLGLVENGSDAYLIREKVSTKTSVSGIFPFFSKVVYFAIYFTGFSQNEVISFHGFHPEEIQEPLELIEIGQDIYLRRVNSPFENMSGKMHLYQ